MNNMNTIITLLTTITDFITTIYNTIQETTEKISD